MKLAVLIASHNRRETTLRCLHALFASHLPHNLSLEIFLVDDGSSDGTADAVGGVYPEVRLLHGDGALYWNGAMRMAFAAAMEKGFDHYLWLNDDTNLYPDTVTNMLRVSREARRTGLGATLVVGSTHSRPGGPVNHGGIKAWRRLGSDLVVPQDLPVPCATMYGNCVLVPDEIARSVGNLDGVFVHSIGDVDYGLRVARAGFTLLVMPGFAGTCELNPVTAMPHDPSLSLAQRFQRLLGPKGLPPRPWLVFLWRHFGVRGLLYWAWTYIKVPLSWIQARLRVT